MGGGAWPQGDPRVAGPLTASARSPAEVQRRAHGPPSRSEAHQRRRIEALEELEIVIEPDPSRCPGLSQRRHVTGGGREAVVERQEVSGAA